jgi:hypothetical protein
MILKACYRQACIFVKFAASGRIKHFNPRWDLSLPHFLFNRWGGSSQEEEEKNSATVILDYKPGEVGQVDFGTGPEIIDAWTGECYKTWFFVILQLIDSDQELEIYFLFEHKSFPDKFTRLQILNYMIQSGLI